MLVGDPTTVGTQWRSAASTSIPPVGQHPIHLLDGVLGGQTARQGEPLADRMHSQ